MLFLTVFLGLWGYVYSAIIGEPKIQCSSIGVTVLIEHDKPFTGALYLRGNKEKQSCKADFSKNPAMNISYEFPFDSCPSRRKRQLAPSRGMMMSSVLVVSHHGLIITHKDVAYQIDCFYKEERSQVDASLNVSTPPPHILADQPALPKCDYRLELASISSNQGGVASAVTSTASVSFAQLGESVVHVWSCDGNAPTDVYCMQVHNCMANDGQGNQVQVVDEKGCSMDGELLSPIRYTSPLRAVATSQVFKFADRSSVYFKCDVRLLDKSPADECPLPTCSNKTKRAVRHSFRVARDLPVAAPELVVEPRAAFEHLLDTVVLLPDPLIKSAIQPMYLSVLLSLLFLL
ncbi:unnamed protein product [Caenorhabditis auriculariae]|uniref:ZP domain-containing protein n=1 Tax=Caenorhabditis auriculariae TaxID=2777116 RepID=A0A8S1HJ41_9PELO|nr:unnamed protein product [Caenorhabditis auriculariae]